MFVAAVLVCIAILPDTRVSLLVSAGWVAVVYVAYRFYARTRASQSPARQDKAESGQSV